ncbi:MAG: ImmA/IrrE family metallo-endopeptidase [Clostridia bacterium]|nr:ImmA/IrrE family metallo-endopeptidase [Clostridia bacterium]
MDKLALDFLTDYGLFHFPVDVFYIATEILHVDLIKYSSLSQSKRSQILSKPSLEKGFTITEHYTNGSTGHKIYYNDSSNIYRQRFTIAHEIKHILCGEEEYTADSEILADYFSKALQAPKCVMILNNINSIEKCVTHFSLSYEASTYWIQALRNRIRCVGSDLFDYESDYIQHFIKYNTQ